MIRVQYTEETDRVVIEIESDGTKVEHELSPEQLERLEFDVQRAMVRSGIKPHEYLYDDDEE